MYMYDVMQLTRTLHYPCEFHRKDGNIIFETLNLNTQANWYTDDPPESSAVPVLCLQQLEKDTIFLGLERILFKRMQYDMNRYIGILSRIAIKCVGNLS